MALALWKHLRTKHFPIFFPPTIECNAQRILLGWCRSFIVVDGMLAKGGASAANQKYLTCHTSFQTYFPALYSSSYLNKNNDFGFHFTQNLYCPIMSDALYLQLT